MLFGNAMVTKSSASTPSFCIRARETVRTRLELRERHLASFVADRDTIGLLVCPEGKYPGQRKGRHERTTCTEPGRCRWSLRSRSQGSPIARQRSPTVRCAHRPPAPRRCRTGQRLQERDEIGALTVAQRERLDQRIESVVRYAAGRVVIDDGFERGERCRRACTARSPRRCAASACGSASGRSVCNVTSYRPRSFATGTCERVVVNVTNSPGASRSCFGASRIAAA